MPTDLPSTAELAAWKRVAEAAPQKRWERNGWRIWAKPIKDLIHVVIGATNASERTGRTAANLDHIATFSPPNVLRLIAAAEQLYRYRTALESIREFDNTYESDIDAICGAIAIARTALEPARDD